MAWLDKNNRALTPTEFKELIENSAGIRINGKFFPNLKKVSQQSNKKDLESIAEKMQS